MKFKFINRTVKNGEIIEEVLFNSYVNIQSMVLNKGDYIFLKKKKYLITDIEKDLEIEAPYNRNVEISETRVLLMELSNEIK